MNSGFEESRQKLISCSVSRYNTATYLQCSEHSAKLWDDRWGCGRKRLWRNLDEETEESRNTGRLTLPPGFELRIRGMRSRSCSHSCEKLDVSLDLVGIRSGCVPNGSTESCS